MATNPQTIEIPESHAVSSYDGLNIFDLAAGNDIVDNDSVHCDYDSKNHLDFCQTDTYT